MYQSSHLYYVLSNKYLYHKLYVISNNVLANYINIMNLSLPRQMLTEGHTLLPTATVQTQLALQVRIISLMNLYFFQFIKTIFVIVMFVTLLFIYIIYSLF